MPLRDAASTVGAVRAHCGDEMSGSGNRCTAHLNKDTEMKSSEEHLGNKLPASEPLFEVLTAEELAMR